jgi:hypothetical protein
MRVRLGAGDYWTVIVTSNRQFYYTQTENIRNFE